MAFVAALDIGYSNLKVAWLSVKEEPLHDLFLGLRQYQKSPEERRSAALQTRLFPAGAAPVEDLVDGLGAGVSGHTVMVGDTKWRAPIDFSESQVSYRDFSHEYVRRDVWLALLKGGLAEIGETEIETLVLGLPCAEYYETPELRNVVIEKAKGVHELDGLTVTVKNVKVIPQPLGTFYGQLLTSDREQAEFLMESIALVADPGYYSCDWVVVDEGQRINQGSSASTPNSVRAICEGVQERLIEKLNVPLQAGRIERQLRRGKLTIPTGSQLYNFESDLKAVAKEVAESTLTVIRSRLHSAGDAPNIAILTGGGADLFEPYVKEGARVAAVYKAKDPVMMNVLGYLRAAC